VSVLLFVMHHVVKHVAPPCVLRVCTMYIMCILPSIQGGPRKIDGNCLNNCSVARSVITRWAFIPDWESLEIPKVLGMSVQYFHQCWDLYDSIWKGISCQNCYIASKNVPFQRCSCLRSQQWSSWSWMAPSVYQSTASNILCTRFIIMKWINCFNLQLCLVALNSYVWAVLENYHSSCWKYSLQCDRFKIFF